jgi:hypothetical protein
MSRALPCLLPMFHPCSLAVLLQLAEAGLMEEAVRAGLGRALGRHLVVSPKAALLPTHAGAMPWAARYGSTHFPCSARDRTLKRQPAPSWPSKEMPCILLGRCLWAAAVGWFALAAWPSRGRLVESSLTACRRQSKARLVGGPFCCIIQN